MVMRNMEDNCLVHISSLTTRRSIREGQKSTISETKKQSTDLCFSESRDCYSSWHSSTHSQLLYLLPACDRSLLNTYQMLVDWGHSVWSELIITQ